MRAAFERAGEEAARATARRIFEAVVGLADPREVERQQRSGVCERIVSVTSMLARDHLRFPHGFPGAPKAELEYAL